MKATPYEHGKVLNKGPKKITRAVLGVTAAVGLIYFGTQLEDIVQKISDFYKENSQFSINQMMDEKHERDDIYTQLEKTIRFVGEYQEIEKQYLHPSKIIEMMKKEEVIPGLNHSTLDYTKKKLSEILGIPPNIKRPENFNGSKRIYVNADGEFIKELYENREMKRDEKLQRVA